MIKTTARVHATATPAMAPALSGKVLAADEAATNVETAAGLDEIIATVTLRLEVVGQSLVILFTEHDDARAPVLLQIDKMPLSEASSSVFEYVARSERHSSHSKKAMLKLLFGKHAASLLSSATRRALSVPDIYWLASLAECKQWLLGMIHLPQNPKHFEGRG
jgi:hypothetical protein